MANLTDAFASYFKISDAGTKQDTLVSGTNIKTINSTSLLGSGDITMGATALTVSAKTGSYTVVAGDLGTVINCTSGAFTVSLTAAATLGAGFNCWIWNTNTTATNAITIDPSNSETIDGVSTLVLRRGEGVQIVCTGTAWNTGDKKVMRGYAENIENTRVRPIASGNAAISMGADSSATGLDSVALGTGANGTADRTTAIGYLATASADSATAIGYSAQAINTNSYSFGRQATASGIGSLALGYISSASANYSTAVGANTAGQGGIASATGAGVVGGGRARGVDSFGAAMSSNSSTYGAQGANSVALGALAKAAGANSFAFSAGTTAGAAADGIGSIALGNGAQAAGAYSIALGSGSSAPTYGKYAFASGFFAAAGDAQQGDYILRASTTSATPVVLTSDAASASATNQLVLPNASARAFVGTVVARQSTATGTQSAAWKIEGLIRRDGSAGTTTLVASTVTAISNVPGWTLALTANVSTGCLTVTATGAAATNIRWVAVIDATEITYT